MDMSLVSAMLGAQAGAAQVTVAAKFMRENADAAGAIAQVIDAAAQNAKSLDAKSLDTNSLANVAQGVGTNLDVTA
jgi:hypothetical protein